MMTRMLDPRFGWKKSSEDDLIDSHEFCVASEVIFPRMNTTSVTDGFTLSQGAHSYGFEISFPRRTSCKQESYDQIKHLITTPPPTFESTFVDRFGIGKVEYILKVHVRRPKRWHRDCSAERKLEFRPPNSSLSYLSTSFPYSVVSAALEFDHNVSEELPPEPSTDHNPGPVLLLEVRLPSPAVLYTGERPLLRLIVRRFTTALNDLPSVELRSVAVHLISTIIIKAESSRIAWDASRTILDKTGLQVPFIDVHRQENSESFEINSSLLDGIVIPRDIAPSFTTCTIRQDHALKVIAGFAMAGDEKLRLVEATINAEIHSGIEIESRSLVPPEYDMGSHSLIFSVPPLAPAEASRIPLRRGCLQHLGLNNNSSNNSALQPPAYGISQGASC